MPDVINRLSEMEIDEISFVDRGANQHAAVLIHKSDGEEFEVEATEEVLKALEEAGVDITELTKASPDVGDMHIKKPLNEEDEKDDEEKEDGTLRRVIGKMFGNHRKQPPGFQGPPMQPQMGMPMQQPQMGMPQPQMPMQPPGFAPQTQPQMGMPQGAPQGVPPMGMGEPPDPSGGLAPLPEEALEYIKQLEDEVQRLSQSVNGDQNAGGSPFGKSEEFENMSDAQTFLDEVAKSLENEEQKDLIYKALDLVADAEERAAEATEIAKAEREHRLNSQFVELAKQYNHLPVSAEELGPVLKAMYETLDEEQVKTIEKCFGTVNDVTAGLFGEIGKRGGYDTSIVSKVEAEAEAIVKSDDGLSKEQAIEQVLSNDPALYDEYVRESAQLIREV